MCFGAPSQPKPYAPPSGPPGSSMTPVPDWMVREVLEQRHSVRTKRKKKVGVLTPGSSQTSDINASIGVVGKDTLGGDS
jgi:hypothetical protein